MGIRISTKLIPTQSAHPEYMFEVKLGDENGIDCTGRINYNSNAGTFHTLDESLQTVIDQGLVITERHRLRIMIRESVNEYIVANSTR